LSLCVRTKPQPGEEKHRDISGVPHTRGKGITLYCDLLLILHFTTNGTNEKKAIFDYLGTGSHQQGDSLLMSRGNQFVHFPVLSVIIHCHRHILFWGTGSHQQGDI